MGHEKKKWYLAFIATLILWLAVASVDRYVTYEINLSIFYLIPISYAVFSYNFVVGTAISFLSAAMWIYNDAQTGHKYSNELMPIWNATARLGYFILHSYFLSRYTAYLSLSHAQANTDLLTGAYNRRHLYARLPALPDTTVSLSNPLTLAYIDLDNFKLLNDSQGHQAGDELLQAFSKIVSEKIRSSDTFARLGGDEFVILIRGMNFEAADELLKAIRTTAVHIFRDRQWPVTLSVGAITCTRLQMPGEHLIREADKLMYAVKKQGKNNIRHLREE